MLAMKARHGHQLIQNSPFLRPAPPRVVIADRPHKFIARRHAHLPHQKAEDEGRSMAAAWHTSFVWEVQHLATRLLADQTGLFRCLHQGAEGLFDRDRPSFSHCTHRALEATSAGDLSCDSERACCSPKLRAIVTGALRPPKGKYFRSERCRPGAYECARHSHRRCGQRLPRCVR